MGSEGLAIGAQHATAERIDEIRGRAAAALDGSGAREAVDLLAGVVDEARAVGDEQFCRVVVELLDAVRDLGDLDRQQQAVALAVEAASRAGGATAATRSLVFALTARIATARGDTDAADDAVAMALASAAAGTVDARSTVALALSLHRATNGVGDRTMARRFVDMGRTAARETEDHCLELRVEVAAAVDALDAGDRAALMHALARIDELRRFATSPVVLLEARAVENSLAILEGRYESAGAGLGELDELVARAAVDSPVVWRQFAALALDTADLASFLPVIVEQSDSFPQSATLHALAALAHLRAGAAAEARSIVTGFATAAFRDLGAGGPAPVTGAILAQTVHELGAVDLATPLLDALAPFGERCVVDVTGSAIWLGSLDHHRGLLASLAGRHDDALALLDRAARTHEAMGARPWTVRTALAAALARERSLGAGASSHEAVALRDEAMALAAELGMIAPPQPSTAAPTAPLLWRRQGEHWEIGPADAPRHVAHRVGLVHLGRLLAAPSTTITAVELDRGANGARRSAAQSRVNVTKAIRSAIALVGEHDPVLGAHLDAGVRTGAGCRYTPDLHDTTWSVDLG